jgi:hypothetical protein
LQRAGVAMFAAFFAFEEDCCWLAFGMTCFFLALIFRRSLVLIHPWNLFIFARLALFFPFCMHVSMLTYYRYWAKIFSGGQWRWRNFTIIDCVELLFTYLGILLPFILCSFFLSLSGSGVTLPLSLPLSLSRELVMCHGNTVRVLLVDQQSKFRLHRCNIARGGGRRM